MPEWSDVARTGAELVHPVTGNWLTPRDVTGHLVVLVHGFTSHGRYMHRLASFLADSGFAVGAFNYDSYRGIDAGAAALGARVDPLGDPLREHGWSIVAHSMGGVVARQYLAAAASAAAAHLRGIVTLGTPHRGTLTRKAVSYMLDWADAFTGPNPYARTPGCRAAAQLTGGDADQLIASLNRGAGSARQVPLLSVSGGLAFLETGDPSNRWYAGALRNRILQHVIAEVPNDGLVGESSADVTQVLGTGPRREHWRDYGDYHQINHTYLTQNQQVALRAVEWLRAQSRPAR